jgi:menaquinone-specific isochorismate synthase
MQSQSATMAWLARTDGSLTVGHGPFTHHAQPPADGTAFFISDFALQEPLPWRVPHRVERLAAAEFITRFPNAQPFACEFQAPDATPFSGVFQEVMAAIHAGFFEKTVPVVTECGIAADPPDHAIPPAMAACLPPLMSYGWLGPDSGFAGATPERLFSLCDGHLETMALAGTARSEDRDVFAADEKEIREHEFVAQALVAKLADLGTPQRMPREILDLGSIVHFHTALRMKVAGGIEPAGLIRRLHPTPALGPLPRTAATMQRLLQWRGRLGCPVEFGAPFGLLDHARFDAVVAIRGVWWNLNEVRIPSGCGIIEASRLVNEWRELRLKRESVKKLLQPPQSR